MRAATMEVAKWQTVRTTRATAGESVANQLRMKVKVENSVGSLGHWQWTVWAVGAHCWIMDSGHFHCVSCGSSRRQECVTGSSTHAEVVAASTNSNDAVWVRGYLREIGLPQDEPTPFMVDAKNVLALVQNLISSKLTRHITRRELIVREREVEGEIIVTKVHTDDNLADMFTKVLDRTYSKLRGLVLNTVVRAASAILPRSRRMRVAD